MNESVNEMMIGIRSTSETLALEWGVEISGSKGGYKIVQGSAENYKGKL
jgi:hypothetical protein